MNHHPFNNNNNNNNDSSLALTSSLHDLSYGDDDFVVQAWQAARHNLTGTIRRVLRAVAVQALQQQLQQQQQQHAAHHHSSQRIVISAQDIKAVQTFCRRLAKCWSDANRTMGNGQLATWIQDIVQLECDTLFFRQDNDGDDDDEDEDDPFATTTEALAAASPTAATAVAPTKHHSQRLVTPYAKLCCLQQQQQLPNINKNNNTTLLRDTIAALDHLAKRQHGTYWPESWRKIQSAAALIPSRLYKNVPQQVEIVKKSQDDNDNTDNNLNTHQVRKATDWLMDRKRKSVGRERLPQKRQKQKASSNMPQPPPPPRSPSNFGSAQWTIAAIQESFTAPQRQALNGLVISHGDDEQQQESSSSSSPPSLILGALMNLGQYHHYRQSAIDLGGDGDGDDDRAPTTVTPLRRRRHQRRSIAERMGNHHLSTTDYGIMARRVGASRVAQTADAAQQAWRNADLQHVWLEVFDNQTQQRYVLALETLEVILLDEENDALAVGWQDEEDPE